MNLCTETETVKRRIRLFQHEERGSVFHCLRQSGKRFFQRVSSADQQTESREPGVPGYFAVREVQRPHELCRRAFGVVKSDSVHLLRRRFRGNDVNPETVRHIGKARTAEIRLDQDRFSREPEGDPECQRDFRVLSRRDDGASRFAAVEPGCVPLPFDFPAAAGIVENGQLLAHRFTGTVIMSFFRKFMAGAGDSSGHFGKAGCNGAAGGSKFEMLVIVCGHPVVAHMPPGVEVIGIRSRFFEVPETVRIFFRLELFCPFQQTVLVPGQDGGNSAAAQGEKIFRQLNRPYFLRNFCCIPDLLQLPQMEFCISAQQSSFLPVIILQLRGGFIDAFSEERCAPFQQVDPLVHRCAVDERSAAVTGKTCCVRNSPLHQHQRNTPFGFPVLKPVALFLHWRPVEVTVERVYAVQTAAFVMICRAGRIQPPDDVPCGGGAPARFLFFINIL